MKTTKGRNAERQNDDDHIYSKIIYVSDLTSPQIIKDVLGITLSNRLADTVVSSDEAEETTNDKTHDIGDSAARQEMVRARLSSCNSKIAIINLKAEGICTVRSTYFYLYETRCV